MFGKTTNVSDSYQSKFPSHKSHVSHKNHSYLKNCTSHLGRQVGITHLLETFKPAFTSVGIIANLMGGT